VRRGAVLLLLLLLLMGLAGLLGIGPVERRLGRPRLLVAGFATCVALCSRRSRSGRAPLPAAAGLPVLLCLSSCFPVLW
jgi:hypothetical protein